METFHPIAAEPSVSKGSHRNVCCKEARTACGTRAASDDNEDGQKESLAAGSKASLDTGS